MTLQSDLTNKLDLLFKNNYKSVGYNFLKVRKIKSLPNNRINNSILFGKNIYFRSPFEYLHSLSEIFVHEIYKIKLPPEPFIIDCGANIGISVLYFKKTFPHSILLAFEPDKENFNLLNLNVKSFQLTNTQLYNEAIWTENTYLNFSNDSSMSSKISDEINSATNSVKATRLFDLINQKVDFLKIDIEGAEYQVLLDIQDKLHFVQNMFFEYHGSFSQSKELTFIFNILSEQGFTYYIKEAAPIYKTPFNRDCVSPIYDVQLNIFCFKQILN